MIENHHGTPPRIWDPLAAWPAARVWLWAALAGLVVCSQGPSFIRNLRPPSGLADFFQEWASARNAYEGLAIYTDQKQTVKRYLGIETKSTHGLYVRWNAHPPTSVLLAVPFAALGYSDATLAWNIASLAALAASLWLLVRGVGLTPRWWWIFPTTALLLTCGPFRQQINQAQLNLVLLLLISGVWVAERSGKPWLAGGLLGAATAIKLFPGLLFLFFLLRRQRAVVIAGVVSLAALTTATAVLLGPDTYRDYIQLVLPEVSRYRNAWANASLWGFWIKVFGDGAWHSRRQVLPVASLPELVWAGGAVSWATVLILWARAVWRAGTRTEVDHAFGLTLVAMIVLSPIAWDHYFVLLALPLIQLWIALPHSTAAQSVRLGLLALLWANQGTMWRIFLPDDRFLGGSVWAPLPLLTLLSYQCYTLLALFSVGLVLVKGTQLYIVNQPDIHGVQ